MRHKSDGRRRESAHNFGQRDRFGYFWQYRATALFHSRKRHPAPPLHALRRKGLGPCATHGDEPAHAKLCAFLDQEVKGLPAEGRSGDRHLQPRFAKSLEPLQDFRYSLAALCAQELALKTMADPIHGEEAVPRAGPVHPPQMVPLLPHDEEMLIPYVRRLHIEKVRVRYPLHILPSRYKQ